MSPSLSASRATRTASPGTTTPASAPLPESARFPGSSHTPPTRELCLVRPVAREYRPPPQPAPPPAPGTRPPGNRFPQANAALPGAPVPALAQRHVGFDQPFHEIDFLDLLETLECVLRRRFLTGQDKGV